MIQFVSIKLIKCQFFFFVIPLVSINVKLIFYLYRFLHCRRQAGIVISISVA